LVAYYQFVGYWVPEATVQKGSMEIIVEIISQVVVMFLGMMYIHRIVTYFPTYSGKDYSEFSVTNVILAVLISITSFKSKLGDKITILVDRVRDYWSGNDKKKNNAGNNGNNGGGDKQTMRVIQPLITVPSELPSGTTSIQSLSQQTDPNMNYDAMYRKDTTPLMGANTIMAANELGSPFGSVY
jgi:hypothetical protein